MSKELSFEESIVWEEGEDPTAGTLTRKTKYALEDPVTKEQLGYKEEIVVAKAKMEDVLFNLNLTREKLSEARTQLEIKEAKLNAIAAMDPALEAKVQEFLELQRLAAAQNNRAQLTEQITTLKEQISHDEEFIARRTAQLPEKYRVDSDVPVKVQDITPQ